MYWRVALSSPMVNYASVGEISATMDDYGFTSSWRANDNDADDMWYASDPENSSTYLWGALPNVFLLDTSSMVIYKTQDEDGNIDVPTEVAANNN